MQFLFGLDKNTDILPLMPEEEKVTHSPEVVCGKSDTLTRPRHSERQRIPSKRLGFPDAYPVIQPQKKSTKTSKFFLYYYTITFTQTRNFTYIRRKLIDFSIYTEQINI